MSERVLQRWVWRALLSGLTLWALISLQWGRAIGSDEVEFLRATDWIRQGQVPYRDFFEHHTPLTWFFMAPFESLLHGPGVAPILWMRWVQVPLWGVVIWRLNRWMKEDEITTCSRYFVIGCLLGTPFFVFSALEYRVDTLAVVCFVLALDRLRRPGLSPSCAAGAMLACAGLANLRFVPTAIILSVAAAAIDLQAKRWCFRPNRLGMLALGGVLALLPWLAYLALTGSAVDFWRWCIDANRVADGLVHPFRRFRSYLHYPLVHGDLPGLSLECGMLIGAGLVMRRFRKPEFIHLLLLAQIANLAFVARMKVQYLYHFELSLCLAVPLAAEMVDRLSQRVPRLRFPRWVAPGVLLFALLMNGATAWGMNDHATLAFQDRTLKHAARLAPGGATVLDGCGWLLGSRPAYRFWFLPLLTRLLTRDHWVASYSVTTMEQDPPALVIADIRLAGMLHQNRAIGLWVTTHYLPITANLWLPGLSRVLTPVRPRWRWNVLASGEYRVLCSPRLARHPWFTIPFYTLRPTLKPEGGLQIDPATFRNVGAERVHWRRDGVTVIPHESRIHLSQGQSIEAEVEGGDALGVMLVPVGTGPLFSPRPPDVALDYLSFDKYWPGT